MRRLFGNALLGLGIVLLALTAGLYGYGEYEQRQFERGQADLDSFERATATAVAIGEIAARAQASGLATATAAAAARVPTPAPTPTVAASEGATTATPPAAAPVAAPAAPTSTPPARPSPTHSPTVTQIRRIVAKSIALDAPVVEAKLRQGEWDVPKFVAGHLEGTALPGGGGNVVLSGHVQSLTSGNVFANLERLKSGDEVVLRTNLGEMTYRITGRNVVPNNDLSVVRPTGREEVTLITCTGAFNPLTRDYSHRLVVWGELAG
jgi:sortase A